MKSRKRDKALGDFVALCKAVPSKGMLEELFELFFTPEELEQLAGRHEVVRALLEGKLAQREIVDKFGVSITQITRGSNALKSINPSLKSFLSRWRNHA